MNEKSKSKREPRGKSEHDEEKRHKRRRKEKMGERERKKTRTIWKLDNIVKEERRKNDNNGRIERNMLPVSHAMVRYPKKYVKRVPDVKKTRKANDVICLCSGVRGKKKRTRASTSSAQQRLGCHTNGFSMRTHAGRMSGQSLKHLHLQIHGELPHLQKMMTAEIQKQLSTTLQTFWRSSSSKETASCTAEAIVGNGLSVVPTRTLNFGGGMRKRGCKNLSCWFRRTIQSTTSPTQRRTCVRLRRTPTELLCASWSA